MSRDMLADSSCSASGLVVVVVDRLPILSCDSKFEEKILQGDHCEVRLLYCIIIGLRFHLK